MKIKKGYWLLYYSIVRLFKYHGRSCFLMLIGMIIWNHHYAQQKDTLWLQNGQLLIGEIKTVKLGVLSIDEKDLGILDIKIYKISRLDASTSFFRIETNNKETYFSKMMPSKKRNEVVIESSGEEIVLQLKDISLLLPLEKGFFNQLDGTLGLGFSFTKSSTIGQMNLNSTVYYNTRLIDYQLTASAIYTIDSSEFSRDNELVQVFGAYSFSKSWFVFAQFAYQRNLELSLARRFQEMLGAGNKIIMKNDWSLKALSGITLGQEKSTENNSRLTVELPLMFRFNFFKYQKVNLQLNATQTLYLSLSQKGRFRYDGNISFSQELIHNFNLNVNIYSNYDNKPPETGSSRTDFGGSLGVSYRF